MKFLAFLLASLSVAAAFAPQQSSRVNTELSASLFDRIANMDLFDAKGNEYGARKNKNVRKAFYECERKSKGEFRLLIFAAE